MKNTILFISHEATRTGAPILLLDLLRWIKKNTELMPIVLLREGGFLQSEFESIAQTFVWKLEPRDSVWLKRWHRLIGVDEEQNHQQRIISQLVRLMPQIIYANTVVSSELAVILSKSLCCPVICHVHELQYVIQETVGNKGFTQIISSIDCFIAASEAVVVNLANSYNIPRSKIKKVHEFISVLESGDFELAKNRIREELGISSNDILVLGCGTIEWRKSPELLIQAVQQVQLISGVKPYFVWVGGSIDTSSETKYQYDLQRSGVGDSISFVGTKKNAYEYISAADIFVLTSREDPYPLVCLAAASLGKPIVCFADAGGMPEFVEQDCGIVVPYLRTDLFAKAIVQLQNDKELRLRLGGNAARKLRANHTIDIAGNQIKLILDQYISV